MINRDMEIQRLKNEIIKLVTNRPSMNKKHHLHSELPFTRKRIANSNGEIIHCITLAAKPDNLLLDVVATLSKPNAEANAAFITLAANTHYELVDMVEYASLFIYEVAPKLDLTDMQKENLTQFLEDATGILSRIKEASCK